MGVRVGVMCAHMFVCAGVICARMFVRAGVCARICLCAYVCARMFVCVCAYLYLHLHTWLAKCGAHALSLIVYAHVWSAHSRVSVYGMWICTCTRALCEVIVINSQDYLLRVQEYFRKKTYQHGLCFSTLPIWCLRGLLYSLFPMERVRNSVILFLIFKLL
jgi:hypothetical protein